MIHSREHQQFIWIISILYQNITQIILFQSEINLLQTTQQLYSSLRGVKLLCSLEIQQQILLYLLSNGSRVNRLCCTTEC